MGTPSLSGCAPRQNEAHDGAGRARTSCTPVAAGEVPTLLGFLDYQRATLAWKCSGLDAAGLRATTAASTMTLGGILKHMALVEYGWFSRSLHGREYRPP